MKPAAKLFLSPNLDSVYRHCIHQIHEQRQHQSLDLITLVLPRQREINRFRAQLSSVINVALYEFLGLTRDILRESNSPVTELESFAIRQILHDILHEMAVKEQLTTFKSVWDKPGFISMLIQWLREMKSQKILVDDYQIYAGETGLERDVQLSLIYKAYSDILNSNGLADRESMQHAACTALDAHPGIFAAGDSFFILGFDQFNPLQLALIRSVAARKSNTCFYLVWDPDRSPDNLALNRLRRTRDELSYEFTLDEVVIENLYPEIKPALKHLQKTLFVNSRAVKPRHEAEVINLVAAPSREEEVRYSLRAIKRLLLSGVPPGEIALLSPHPESYIAPVRAISRDYGINFDISEGLSNNPAIVAFLNCISLYPEFEWSKTLEVLRSPYVNQPWLSTDQVELLDYYSRLRPVVSGRDQWLFALRSNPLDPNETDDPESLKEHLAKNNHSDDSGAIEAGLVKFFDTLTPPESGTLLTFHKWIQENILGNYPSHEEDEPNASHIESLNLLVGAGEGIFSERDTPALTTIDRILANMSMADRLMPEHQARFITWEEFASELSGMIRTTSLPGEKYYERVLFDRLDAGRGQTVKYLFVIGLGEGEFPAPLHADPLYSNRERLQHPLALRVPEPSDDASLWWQVINNCTTKLTLLRPYLDENGADWSPSAYWDEVRSKYEAIEEHRIPIGAEPDIREAASMSELVAALAVNQVSHVPAELAERWGRALAGRDIQLARLSSEYSGPFEGFLENDQILADLHWKYSANHIWSPSRLNSYNNCPYGYFIQSILKVEALADPGEGIDPLTRGTLLHKILERYVGKLINRGVTPSPQSLDECLDTLKNACDSTLTDAPVKYGFRPGTLWRYEQQEIRRMLELLVEWECEENGDPPRYTPYRTETGFGFRDRSMPPLVIDSDPHDILVHGVIDRIDRDQSGNLRVIDYKSGGTKIYKSDILKGTAMQTALYALAAESLVGEAEQVADSLYLHLPIRKLSGKLTFQGKVTENPDVAAVEDIVRFTVTHIRNGEFPAIPANARGGTSACRDRCDLAGICRVSRQGIQKARQRGF